MDLGFFLEGKVNPDRIRVILLCDELLDSLQFSVYQDKLIEEMMLSENYETRGIVDIITRHLSNALEYSIGCFGIQLYDDDGFTLDERYHMLRALAIIPDYDDTNELLEIIETVDETSEALIDLMKVVCPTIDVMHFHEVISFIDPNILVRIKKVLIEKEDLTALDYSAIPKDDTFIKNRIQNLYTNHIKKPVGDDLETEDDVKEMCFIALNMVGYPIATAKSLLDANLVELTTVEDMAEVIVVTVACSNTANGELRETCSALVTELMSPENYLPVVSVINTYYGKFFNETNNQV